MNKTVKNSGIYLCGTVLLALLGFVNTMILTRVLSQQVYAMYGLLTSFVTSSVFLITLGYDNAFMRFYYSSGYRRLQFLLKCLIVPTSMLTLVLLVLLEPTRSLIIGVFGENLPTFTILLIFCLLFTSVLNRFTIRLARMEEYAGNCVVSSVVSKTGFVLIILIWFNLYKTITFEQVILSFLLCGVLASLVNARVWYKVRDSERDSELDVAPISHKELFHYGAPLMIYQFLLPFVLLLERLVVRKTSGWEALSLYTSASIFQTVILLVSQTVITVWNPLVYKHCDKGDQLKPLIHFFGFASSVLTVCCVVSIVFLRRWLVLLLDSKYHDVYVIMPAIIYGASLSIITVIYSVGIEIRKKTSYVIIIPVLQGIVSISLCFALVSKLGLVGIAIASLVSQLISKGLKMLIGIKLYKTGYSEHKSATLIFLGGLAALASLFFTSFLSDALICMSTIVIVLIVSSKDIVGVVNFLRVNVFLSPKTDKKGCSDEGDSVV